MYSGPQSGCRLSRGNRRGSCSPHSRPCRCCSHGLHGRGCGGGVGGGVHDVGGLEGRPGSVAHLRPAVHRSSRAGSQRSCGCRGCGSASWLQSGWTLHQEVTDWTETYIGQTKGNNYIQRSLTERHSLLIC